MANKTNFISEIVSKKDTQAMIKAMRNAGYTIIKLNSGYISKQQTKQGTPLFKAITGNFAYLVKHHKSVFN